MKKRTVVTIRDNVAEPRLYSEFFASVDLNGPEDVLLSSPSLHDALKAEFFIHLYCIVPKVSRSRRGSRGWWESWEKAGFGFE